MTTQEFQDTLQIFSGTEEYFIHKSVDGGKLLLTEGCNFVREEANAYWLFDLILSYQSHRCMYEQYFQAWKLQKQVNDTWLIVCYDGNDYILVSQQIPYSDFPISYISIWIMGNVALLPSEH